MVNQPEPCIKSKKWYMSKILWAQIITLVLIGIQYAITNHLFSNYAQILLFLDVLLTAAIRLFFTDTNLTK
jgi:hypothetical protein